VSAQAQTVTDPKILSDADAARYRLIFAAERSGQFDISEKLQTELTDTSLIGYVKAEHYLSPKSDRTDVQDLVAWLQQYGDLAIADRIYELAVKRSTKIVKVKRKKVRVAIVTNIPVPQPIRRRGGGYEDTEPAEEPLSSEAGRAVQPQINAAIKAANPVQAESLLVDFAAFPDSPSSDVARLSHRVAASYLAEGQDDNAFRIASGVSASDRRVQPMLDWDAGFALFRLGRYADAAPYFERLARVRVVSNRTRGQAAFWAARSWMLAGNSLRVVTLLQVAANEQPTFYGLLAERVLGVDTQTGFSDPVPSVDAFNAAMLIMPAHRAVALWQVDERDSVRDELNRGFAENDDARIAPVFAYLARRAGMANLELRASEKAASKGVLLTGLFPIPPYRPEGGYRVDPSLVLAFARAESRFQESVVSPAGARGLMQLMPGTAVHLGGNGASDPARLNDPTYNLSLGQRYLEEMLDRAGGNLLYLPVAYNAGPGALQRWQSQRAGKNDDPLTFIESVPSAETRAYIKRIMTYHWMYRARMGRRDVPSLNETASGAYPVYRRENIPMVRENGNPGVKIADAAASH
jgi:soluble lytic murein transglycosylase-like protein